MRTTLPKPTNLNTTTMSFEVDTALVNAYRSNIDLEMQQMGSRLRPYVRVESQNSEFEFYDRIGQVEAVEVSSRHSDTPLISTPHDRRRCQTKDFDWADLIDRRDKLRMLADPTSAYTKNAVAALGRQFDRQIITAGFGTAFTGKNGSNAVQFPSTSTIAPNYSDDGGSSNTNLTVGKLRKVRLDFDLEEATGVDGEAEVFAAVTAYQINSLLRETEVTNADYNAIKALVHGEVDQFLGIKFIRVEHTLLPKTGNIRDCLFFTRQGICMGVADEVMVDVGPRRDKRNSVQVYVCGSFGGVRMWEEKVRKVQCDETA